LGAFAPSPIQKNRIKNFQVNKAFDVKAEKLYSANQRNCNEELILLQLLVKPDQSNMAFQLPMINHTLFIV